MHYRISRGCTRVMWRISRCSDVGLEMVADCTRCNFVSFTFWLIIIIIIMYAGQQFRRYKVLQTTQRWRMHFVNDVYGRTIGLNLQWESRNATHIWVTGEEHHAKHHPSNQHFYFQPPSAFLSHSRLILTEQISNKNQGKEKSTTDISIRVPHSAMSFVLTSLRSSNCRQVVYHLCSK